MGISTDSIDSLVTLPQEPSLTVTERLVLRGLIEAIGLYGSPSLTEIAHCSGPQYYPSNVRLVLRSLAQKGYVEIMPGRARGIRLVRSEVDG